MIEVDKHYKIKDSSEIVLVVSILNEKSCIAQKANGMHVFLKKDELEEVK